MIKETTVTFFLPHELKEKIKNTAHDKRLGMSEFIRAVLSDYIKDIEAFNILDNNISMYAKLLKIQLLRMKKSADTITNEDIVVLSEKFNLSINLVKKLILEIKNEG